MFIIKICPNVFGLLFFCCSNSDLTVDVIIVRTVSTTDAMSMASAATIVGIAGQVLLHLNSDTCYEKPLVLWHMWGCSMYCHITVAAEKSTVFNAKEITSFFLHNQKIVLKKISTSPIPRLGDVKLKEVTVSIILYIYIKIYHE
jgi:hypothetical protein